ncbi:MAG TPA: hypothetical protein DCS29_01465 [Candidatus Magasanikbacteria bacterium]|nr:MAG: hypothetical protein A2479_04340 [Candidatus Magasanikbacteria bacterium RIFOXYC2_FULL_39_8]HAT03429.1 hypothetical protein [Candidatus Magasanikbacteria bacterium]
MKINLKQLKQLPVETQSGVVLGKVHDVILQTDGQLVAQYIVKSSVFGKREYIVSRDQVVQFEQDKMIVDDTTLTEQNKTEEKNEQSVSTPEPIAMIEEY